MRDLFDLRLLGGDCHLEARLRADCWECTPAIKKTVAEVTRFEDPRGEGAGADLLGAQERALPVGRRQARLHAARPGRRAGQPPGRLQGHQSVARRHAVRGRSVRWPGDPGERDDGQVVESVPSPWGTHAILLVTLDGKDHWIDTTATLAAWDGLPRNCRNRLCYVLDAPSPLPLSPPGGRGVGVRGIRLKRTPPLTADEHRFEQETHVTIASDGSSRSVRNTVYYGLAAYNQRDRWLEVPVGEQRRLTAARLQDTNSQIRLCRLDVDEAALEAFDGPVRDGDLRNPRPLRHQGP